MPYIEIKTTRKVTPKHKAKIAERMIASFAEVSDEYVSGNIQLTIMDDCWSSFRKTHDQPSVYIQISPGPLTPKEHYAGIVEAFFRIITKELDIPQNRVYITVTEIQNWGYDGRLL